MRTATTRAGTPPPSHNPGHVGPSRSGSPPRRRCTVDEHADHLSLEVTDQRFKFCSWRRRARGALCRYDECAKILSVIACAVSSLPNLPSRPDVTVDDLVLVQVPSE